MDLTIFRAQGTMNISDSDPTLAIPQGVGNSQWEVGTGQIIRGELGYLLPGKGMKNRLTLWYLQLEKLQWIG